MDRDGCSASSPCVVVFGQEISKSVGVHTPDAPYAPLRHVHAYTEFLSSSESDDEIFHALLAGVEQSVAEIDAVYEASGLIRAATSGLSAHMRVDSALGRTIEICAAKELPFGVHETGAIVWNHYQFAKRSMPPRFYTYHAHKVRLLARHDCVLSVDLLTMTVRCSLRL